MSSLGKIVDWKSISLLILKGVRVFEIKIYNDKIIRLDKFRLARFKKQVSLDGVKRKRFIFSIESLIKTFFDNKPTLKGLVFHKKNIMIKVQNSGLNYLLV